jgi:hypothetical protein
MLGNLFACLLIDEFSTLSHSTVIVVGIHCFTATPFTNCRTLVFKCFVITITFPFSVSYSSLSFIPLSGVGITSFSSCCDKDSAIILLPASCLTSNLLKIGVGAKDCKCRWDQQFNVLSEARRSSRLLIFGHASNN